MNRRKLLATATLAATLGWATPAWAEDPLKVGFVYVGPVGDADWTYAHQGRSIKNRLQTRRCRWGL